MEFQNIVRHVLRLIFAAGGLILLFYGSFSHMQFEGRASLKGMCFIILSLGVSFFVYKPLKCNDIFEKLCKMKSCKMNFLMIAVMKFLLLGLFSMVIFFTKYPSGLIHQSKSKEERSRKVYDLFGVGSFSAFALVISWERQDGGAGFGVFEFMLELTMDASMDIPAGNDDGSGPNLWYMVGAYFYCFLLLIIRSYGYSLSIENGISNYFGPLHSLLQDQNDQPLGTHSHTTDLERQLSEVPFRHYNSNYGFHGNSFSAGSSTSSSRRILGRSGASVDSHNIDLEHGSESNHGRNEDVSELGLIQDDSSVDTHAIDLEHGHGSDMDSSGRLRSRNCPEMLTTRRRNALEQDALFAICWRRNALEGEALVGALPEEERT